MFPSPPVSGEPDGFAKVMYTEKCDVSVHNNCDTCRFLCQSRFYEILVLFGRVELKDGQIQRLHIYIYTHIYISCIYMCVCAAFIRHFSVLWSTCKNPKCTYSFDKQATTEWFRLNQRRQNIKKYLNPLRYVLDFFFFFCAVDTESEKLIFLLTFHGFLDWAEVCSCQSHWTGGGFVPTLDGTWERWDMWAFKPYSQEYSLSLWDSSGVAASEPELLQQLSPALLGGDAPQRFL